MSLLLVAVAVSGCSADQPDRTDEDVQGDDLPVPSAQAGYFEDDVVTAAEYRTAFNAFVECASGLGVTVEIASEDPSSGLITFNSSQDVFSTSDELTACFDDHFKAAELWYTRNDPRAIGAIADEQMRDFYQLNAPCLRANEVTIPADLEFGTDRFQELVATMNELALDGKCAGVTAEQVAD